MRPLDKDFLWHPYTKQSSVDEGTLPLIVRGEGPYLFDADGRRFFDAVSSWWACSLGHNHPRIVEAITKQAHELQHSILGNLSHPRAVELAERLVALLGGERKVFFSSDGASSVEAALKIAVQYWHNEGHPERCRFASFQEAYHGDTLGSVSVGYLELFHRQFQPLLFPVHRAESPCCSRCAYGLKPEMCGLECFASMQRILDDHGGELAAVIVEPLCQGAAGMRIYTPRYLDRLAGECRRRGVLLIVDEIAMGFGRTGRMFAFQHAGIDPDLVCVGKALSAGYLPISAVVVRDSIQRTFTDVPVDRTFYHGHTFAGNPIACAAALAALSVYEEEGTVEQAARGGLVLERELAVLRGVAQVLDVRCLGMIGAVELGGAPGDAEGIRLARAVRNELFQRDILLRPLGPVVYLMPPLNTPTDALTGLAREVVAVVRAVAEGGMERSSHFAKRSSSEV